MLLWAIFTLGFMFGVFLTLAVFLKRDVVEGVVKTKDAIGLLEGNKHMDSWQVHERLTKVNFFNGGGDLNTAGKTAEGSLAATQ